MNIDLIKALKILDDRFEKAYQEKDVKSMFLITEIKSDLIKLY